jgi:hypothetical protein
VRVGGLAMEEGEGEADGGDGAHAPELSSLSLFQLAQSISSMASGLQEILVREPLSVIAAIVE